MRNIVITVDGPLVPRSVFAMALSSNKINKKFNAVLRRRTDRVSLNADVEGRGALGDPRVDLARVDRYLRV